MTLSVVQTRSAKPRRIAREVQTVSVVTPKSTSKTKAKTKVFTAARRRIVLSLIAATAAGYLPIASFFLAHFQVQQHPALWALVACALGYSAPTVAQWATSWTRNPVKAWGFTLLFEGVMVATTDLILASSGLLILVFINCHSAWEATKESEAEDKKLEKEKKLLAEPRLPKPKR